MSLSKNNKWIFLLFIAPNMILFLLFTYIPIIYTGILSFCKWDFLSPALKFVGLKNYIKLMYDPNFWIVMKNSFIFTLLVVYIAQTLGFFLALLLNRKMRGSKFFQMAAFAPHITTTAAVSIVFILLLDPDMGPLSKLYQFIGVPGISFLSTPGWSLIAISIVGIWKEIGFSTVFFLAGLQSLNKNHYEVAQLYGASRLQTLRHITVPLMTPTIMFLMVSGIIQTMKKFDIVAMMTEGGPIYPDSSTFVFHLYKLSFLDFRAGYSSAFGMIFFVLIVILTNVQIRTSEKWVNYDN